MRALAPCWILDAVHASKTNQTQPPTCGRKIAGGQIGAQIRAQNTGTAKMGPNLLNCWAGRKGILGNPRNGGYNGEAIGQLGQRRTVQHVGCDHPTQGSDKSRVAAASAATMALKPSSSAARAVGQTHMCVMDPALTSSACPSLFSLASSSFVGRSTSHQDAPHLSR